jgi:hypothetical protein
MLRTVSFVNKILPSFNNYFKQLYGVKGPDRVVAFLQSYQLENYQVTYEENYYNDTETILHFF